MKPNRQTRKSVAHAPNNIPASVGHTQEEDEKTLEA